MLGVRHAHGDQGRQNSVPPRPGGHVGLLHLGGEALRVGDAMERVAPGTLMWRSEQDPVDVEDLGVEPHRRYGDACDGPQDTSHMRQTTAAAPIRARPIIRKLSANGSSDAEISLTRSLTASVHDAG
jgi:hypothetical protein